MQQMRQHASILGQERQVLALCQVRACHHTDCRYRDARLQVATIILVHRHPSYDGYQKDLFRLGDAASAGSQALSADLGDDAQAPFRHG